MPFCIDGLSAAQLLYKASQRFRFDVGKGGAAAVYEGAGVAAFGIVFRFQFFFCFCFFPVVLVGVNKSLNKKLTMQLKATLEIKKVRKFQRHAMGIENI